MFKNMTYDSPYFKGSIKEHKVIKNKMLSLIDNMPKSDLHVKDHSNISKLDWNIERNFNREYLKVFEPHLFKYMNMFLEHVPYDKWEIHNIWYQQYSMNSNHGWHVHTECQFTNVYYLELPENTPKTQIINPFTGDLIELEVNEGDLVTFPSFIIHTAPIVKEDARKTIISFNSSLNLKD